MSTTENLATIIPAVMTLLTGLAAVVRALLRILRSVERVTQIAERLAGQLDSHVTHHDEADRALAERVAQHETQIAVMQVKLPPAAAGGTAVSTPT